MAERFDELTKILGSSLSRRQTFRLFAGGVASRFLAPSLTGGVISFFWPEAAQAGRKGLECGPNFCNAVSCGDTDPICCCPSETFCCGTTKTICCREATATAPKEECCGTNCCDTAIGEKCCNLALSLCCIPPGFRLAAYHTYPRNKVEIEVREYTGIGLASVGIAMAVNAQVDIPDFAPGSTYVLVTATRIDQAKPAQLVLKACSRECQGECCENGDPVVTQLRIAQGRNRVTETFTEIPEAERYVTFQNGKKGLNRVHVIVNGQRIANVVLKSDEVRTIDIASALTASSQNSVTVIGRGNSGGSALLVISDVPGASGDKAGNSLPYVVWEEGGGEPGANLRWGM